MAAAQTTYVEPTEREILMAQADVAKAQAKLEADAAKLEADEAKTRVELEQARARLDKAAQEVAELSMQLSRNQDHDFVWVSEGGPRRAVLGVQIDPASGKEGARLLSVSPGGAAAEAGLAKGDVIVALDGKTIAGSPNPNRVVVDHMRAVNPDQKVKVRVLRDGKNKDFVVVARPMMGPRPFNIAIPNGGAMGSVMAGPMPQIREFRRFWPGDFVGMELASLTPKLGAYFGTSQGVLVVQAPQNAAFKLEDGDVIQSIDGRQPEDGGHAMRILRSYKSGEKLNIAVLRQRKPVTLSIIMPDQPEFDADFMQLLPPEPPVPPIPPVPAVPATPAQGS
ncbi:MAG TPA: PDZ domain-containing protein [Steroidobacteraceae bacterium]|nr:PDZ domain-containing protein [Steroidobacteraceae bacterium]